MSGTLYLGSNLLNITFFYFTETFLQLLVLVLLHPLLLPLLVLILNVNQLLNFLEVCVNLGDCLLKEVDGEVASDLALLHSSQPVGVPGRLQPFPLLPQLTVDLLSCLQQRDERANQ